MRCLLYITGFPILFYDAQIFFKAVKKLVPALVRSKGGAIMLVNKKQLFPLPHERIHARKRLDFIIYVQNF